jgi:hypothetical protein
MDDEYAGRPPAGAPDEAPEPGADTGETQAWSAAGQDDEAAPTMAFGGAAPGEEPTEVAPPPGEDATRVMPVDEAASTRVMPAAGAGAPPPPGGAQPTLVMARPPRKGGSSTGWIVLVVVLAALAAGAATWYFLLRDTGTPAPSPSPSPSVAFDWVGAWAPTDGSGGGVVVQQSSGAYNVTVYDPMVRVIGSATAKQSGTDLTFQLQTTEALAGLPGPYSVILSPGSSPDTISMSVTGSNGTTVTTP